MKLQRSFRCKACYIKVHYRDNSPPPSTPWSTVDLTFNQDIQLNKITRVEQQRAVQKSGNEFKSGSEMHPDKKKFKLIRKLETFCGLLNGRFFSNTVFYLRLLYINRTCFIVFISWSLINTPFCSRHRLTGDLPTHQ